MKTSRCHALARAKPQRPESKQILENTQTSRITFVIVYTTFDSGTHDVDPQNGNFMAAVLAAPLDRLEGSAQTEAVSTNPW